MLRKAQRLAIVFALGIVFPAYSAVRAAQISALFSQDVTLHETTTSSGAPGGPGGGRESAATSYFSGNAMKHASADRDSIFRLDQRKMILVDHKKKTYSEVSLDELSQMVEQATARQGMKKEEMEAMRQMMGAASGQVSVSKLGPGEPIAGYSTEKYLLKMPPMEIEIWAAADLTIPAAYYDGLKLSMPPNPMFDMGKMYDEMKKIKGMTVKSVMHMSMMGMNMTTTTLVTSVEKGKIPASTFEVPAGYKATPLKF